MSEAIILITFGALLLLGFATHALGQKTRLPRVSLLLAFGVLVGPVGFGLLPNLSDVWFTTITNLTLVMVGFLLGESFRFSSLSQYGRNILWISLTVVAGTAAVVFLGLVALGVPIVVALLLAGIALATDPAATTDVVRETRSDGPFSRTLLGIVAIDDAWGLIIFSFTLTAAQSVAGTAPGAAPLAHAAREIGLAILVGVGLGIPMAYLTGRVRPGEPTIAEALGMVLLCGGLALWLEASFLLAAMIMGATVANLASHHERPFHAIEGIEWPFLIIFFVLAGASLEIRSLADIGVVGIGYVGFRFAGRLLGGWLGCLTNRADSAKMGFMGLALMPQAGVALGMSLVAVQRIPETKEIILPVVIAATVLFEIVGPILTRFSLVRTGETGQAVS